MDAPMYAMHNSQAPGFYGPSITLPAPVIFGVSPPVMIAPPPMQFHETPPPVSEKVINVPTPQVVVYDDNHPTHRAVLWGGLLAFFSTATFVNGMVRFIQAWPTTLIDGGNLTENNNYFPPIVPLIAAIFAVVIGLTGFLVGLSSILFQAIKPGTAMAAAGFIAVLASYVYVIEVLAQPIFEYTKGTGGFYSGFMPNKVSRPDTNSAVVFSTIFVLFSYFVTSIGMIILTCLELKTALAGAIETLKGAQNKCRLMSVFVFINGISVLVLGCIIYQAKKGLDQNGWERLMAGKWIVSPTWVEFPSITVMTGVFLMVYATPGILATVGMCKIQGWLAILMFLWFVTCHWLLQLSHFGASVAYAAAWMGLLSLMNVAAPVVYGGRVARLARYFH